MIDQGNISIFSLRAWQIPSQLSGQSTEFEQHVIQKDRRADSDRSNSTKNEPLRSVLCVICYWTPSLPMTCYKLHLWHHAMAKETWLAAVKSTWAWDAIICKWMVRSDLIGLFHPRKRLCFVVQCCFRLYRSGSLRSGRVIGCECDPYVYLYACS